MFTKDTRTESFLSQMGVEFSYANRIAFNDLAKNWRETNLARPVPIRDDAVMQYAALMESGSPAPAPILHKADAGYSVLDGLQRIAAAELSGSTGISAYVVVCDSVDILLSINLLANARLQGRAEPIEWTRRRAVEVLVVERGMSTDEVARMGGWRMSDIQSLAENIEWCNVVRGIGGPLLPDTIIREIAENTTREELASSGSPAVEFMNLVMSAKLSADDATPYIREFFKPIAKANRRYEILSERLESIRSEPEIQARVLGRKGAIIPHDVNLRRSMRTVITVLDEITRSSDKLIYVDEFFKLSAEIEKKLHGLAPLHKKPSTARTPGDMWIKQ